MGRRRRKRRKKNKKREYHRYGTVNICMDTWFRTLYLVYGLGLGTPKLISCRVELRRDLRLL